MAENEDKTEPGTSRRREKAREQGRIARSRELVTMSTTAGILFVFYIAGSTFMQNITGLTGRLLGLRYGTDPMAVMRSAGTETMLLLAPFFVAAVVVALFSSVLQGGILLKPVTLEFERLSPLKGFKNIFSIDALPGAIKSFFKFLIGSIVFYYVIKQALPFLPMTSTLGISELQSVAYAMTSKAVIGIFSTFFVLAVLDYIYERWKYERSLRMTKDEIKEEFRESEGDPLIKAKIKSMQREASKRRMMEAVPKATVVITNPTHIAVALLYRKDETSAPKVVAKGKGFVAEAIKQLARTHGIPLVEDKPLARALVKVKLDDFIPADLYRAVAKILAYIYKLKGAAA